MRHGWRAPSPAVGPAHIALATASAAVPESPLLLCPEGQSLPAAGTVGNTQTRTGGGDTMTAINKKLRIMSIM